MIDLRCVCCSNPLEPAQQLRFLVEMENLDNPAYLNRIRVLPTRNGRPVPVCKPCQTRIEANPRPPAHVRPRRATLLGALGLLSVGFLLGSFLGSQG